MRIKPVVSGRDGSGNPLAGRDNEVSLILYFRYDLREIGTYSPVSLRCDRGFGEKALTTQREPAPYYFEIIDSRNRGRSGV